MPPIQTEPSGSSLRSDEGVLEDWTFRGGQVHEVSRTACCRAIASKVDCPSILPPREIQNSIEWPAFLQLGHILAHGGKDAGKAIVGEDSED